MTRRNSTPAPVRTGPTKRQPRVLVKPGTEPSCRICGCTEQNACDGGCSWVEVPKGEAPLCSACQGGAGDLIGVLIDVRAALSKSVSRKIHTSIKAAIGRYSTRLKV